ncbi:MAG: rhodanese-like domain-containing protein [Phormidesmis sp.]
MTDRPTRLKAVKPVFLTPAEANRDREKLLVIDVQTPKFMTHIMPGAQQLNTDISLKDIPKDQPVLLTCLTKQRSVKAAQQFISRGYRRVYVLQGGLVAWQRAGYTVWRAKRPA